MFFTGDFLIASFTVSGTLSIAYVSSWLLYTFGQLVEDTRYITNQNNVIARSVKIIYQPIIDEVEKKRNAEDDAKREAEEKLKHHSEEKKNEMLLQTFLLQKMAR